MGIFSVLQMVGFCKRAFALYLYSYKISEVMFQFLAIAVLLLGYLIKEWIFQKNREKRTEYYRNVYLKSDEWQRKRYVVLKRDNWCCVYCGGNATEVHHKKYARKNIGKEPISWLVSVCKACHESKHKKTTFSFFKTSN